MAYVINEPCIGTKDTSCVEVCIEINAAYDRELRHDALGANP